jgi:hypothetical protein
MKGMGNQMHLQHRPGPMGTAPVGRIPGPGTAATERGPTRLPDSTGRVCDLPG